MRFGGRSPVYRGGFTSKLILKVSSENQDVPVTTLNFDGFSIVKSGDYISAKIPIYDEKRISKGFYTQPGDEDKVFYFKRNFNLEESAIELILLSKDGKVLRKDRAVDYQDFFKD